MTLGFGFNLSTNSRLSFLTSTIITVSCVLCEVVWTPQKKKKQRSIITVGLGIPPETLNPYHIILSRRTESIRVVEQVLRRRRIFIRHYPAKPYTELLFHWPEVTRPSPDFASFYSIIPSTWPRHSDTARKPA